MSESLSAFLFAPVRFCRTRDFAYDARGFDKDMSIMETGASLYSRDGYRIYAIPTEAARAPRDMAYLITTGAGSVLRTELVFEDARRWLDAWIESRIELGFPRRRPPAKVRVQR